MIYGCFVFCCEFVCFVFSLFDLGLLVVWGLCCCWVFCLWWFVFGCGDVGLVRAVTGCGCVVCGLVCIAI